MPQIKGVLANFNIIGISCMNLPGKITKNVKKIWDVTLKLRKLFDLPVSSQKLATTYPTEINENWLRYR